MWKQWRQWRQGRGTRRPAVFGAAVLTVAVLAAACGGTGAQGEGVASVNQGKGTATNTGREGDGQGGRDPEKAMLDFARCMRDHGVDMPDPKAGKGDVTSFEAPAAGAQLPDESKFVEAEKACRHLMDAAGPPKLSPEDEKQMQDAMLAFARCMRDRGVEMPDPQPGGGGIVAKVGEGADPSSPQFQAAEKECKKHTEAIDKKLGVTRREG